MLELKKGTAMTEGLNPQEQDHAKQVYGDFVEAGNRADTAGREVDELKDHRDKVLARKDPGDAVVTEMILNEEMRPIIREQQQAARAANSAKWEGERLLSENQEGYQEQARIEANESLSKKPFINPQTGEEESSIKE